MLSHFKDKFQQNKTNMISKKLALICINYNSYPHLVRFLNSIETSAQGSKIDLQVIVIDNSTNSVNSEVLSDFCESSDLSLRIIKTANVGYFPGAKIGLDDMSDAVKEFDFISISNVDLTLDQFFFKRLGNIPIDESTGVIAPAIISEKRKDDLNPKIEYRPTRSSLERTLKIFSHVSLFFAYRLLSDIKSKLRGTNLSSRKVEMYAPHGSFIIFTKRYFERGGDFDYPRFLFGEEIFVGETCRELNLSIRHHPELVISDIDHGSTSLKSLRFLANEHVKSLNYLLNKYFRKD